jgi:hypothetical protein
VQTWRLLSGRDGCLPAGAQGGQSVPVESRWWVEMLYTLLRI